MEVRINCHKEIRPASSMTNHASNCNDGSSRANCGQDEIMQVLEITDSHEDPVDALMEIDGSKTTGKKFDAKCFPQLQIQG